MPPPPLAAFVTGSGLSVFARPRNLRADHTAGARSRSMTRTLLSLCAIGLAGALAAGCQSREQNPFSGIGPAMIPPPGNQTPGTLPYYPPGTPGGPPATTQPPTITIPGAASSAAPAAATRTNISVAPPTAPSGLSSSFAIDPADRQPIRIVEAAPSATRIATLPPSPQPAAAPVLQAAPAAKEPIQAFSNNPNVSREPLSVSQAPQPNRYAPAGTAPAFNRTRGFLAPPPAVPAGTKPATSSRTNGQSTGGFRTDPSVSPAGYNAGGSAFVESTSAAEGEWRSR